MLGLKGQYCKHAAIWGIGDLSFARVCSACVQADVHTLAQTSLTT